jgi:signal transduction histidine kinase
VPTILKPFVALARTTAFRIVALYGAVFVTVAALITAALFWQTNVILTRQALESLSAEAEVLRSLASSGDANAFAREITERGRLGRGSLYMLIGPDGRRIAGNLTRWPPEVSAPTGGVFGYVGDDGPANSERLAVGIPVALADGRLLLVGRDVQDQLDFLSRVRDTFLVALALLALLGFGAAIAASRLVLRRVERITTASETIMAGDLSRRIKVTGVGDELDDLARNLNTMFERIEQLMSGLREVSDNIAHDLKTPLNRLRNRAEAALRDARSVEDYRAGLEGAIEAADELIKTFNALLLIAKLEAGAVEESFETFDLSALVHDIAELYEPLAQEQGLELRLGAVAQTKVKANKPLIGQAIANLIDNAIKYGRVPGPKEQARAGGAIAIGLTQTAREAEVIVTDHGPGIPAEDRERVLKRFVRLEASRTRPGTGLGLSLVVAVARLHRGGVTLEDNHPGLKARFWLPVRAPG